MEVGKERSHEQGVRTERKVKREGKIEGKKEAINEE